MGKDPLSYQAKLNNTIEDAFAYLLRPSAFQRLLPPWLKLNMLSQSGKLKEKEVIALSFYWTKWVVERKSTPSLHEIDEVQVDGPFKKWEHRLQLKKKDAFSCEIEEILDFESPFPFSRLKAAEALGKIFSWRQEVLRRDLWLQKQYPAKPKRILLSGSSGLVGSSLLLFFRSLGYEVVRLVRSNPASDAISWNPKTSEANIQEFENFDAVIHLAGESIASGRWTKEKKESIFISRVRDTWVLSQIVSRLTHPPQTFLCASAIGYYGNRGEEVLTEESSPGKGFLANVANKWEQAAQFLESKGVRVVHARLGAVLSPKGGLLKAMLPLYRLGLGGRLGQGEQVISWIAIDDLLGAFYHILNNPKVHGAVNCSAPCPVSQKEFSRVLAGVLGRPAFLSVPERLLRLAFGEMAEEIFLASQNALPKKLEETGYSFAFPNLKEALKFWF